jgi:hypothetical protein
MDQNGAESARKVEVIISVNNPLQWSAASRTRLAVVSGLTTAILYCAGYAITGYIRDTSDSVTLDLLLMTAMMVLLLGASFVGALLVGTFVFGERWVQRLVSGRPDEDDSIEAILSPAQNQPIRLSFVLLAVAICHLFTLEYAVTHEFYGYYQDQGRLKTLLRSENPETREAALIEMSDEQGPLLQEYTMEMIVPLLRASDSATRHQALSAVAYVAERMNYSVDLINRNLSIAAGWELIFLSQLRNEVTPLIVNIGRDDADSATRALALEALGSLRARKAIPVLEELLGDANTPNDVKRGALLGLSQMKGQLNAVKPLVAVLESHGPESREAGIAAYALGEVVGMWTPSEMEENAPPQEVKDALNSLAERLLVFSPSNQCIAADAIRKMRNRDARTPLFAHFENPQTNFQCMEDQIDRERRTALKLSVDEPIRVRTLRAIAYIAKNPGTEKNDVHSNEVIRWLRAQQQRDDRYPDPIIRELKNVNGMTDPEAAPSGGTEETPRATGCQSIPSNQLPFSLGLAMLSLLWMARRRFWGKRSLDT